MPGETNGIFISYRRVEADQVASRLYHDLSAKFPNQVFYDHERIPAGTIFRDVLREKISKSDVVLMLIGQQWFDIFSQVERAGAVDSVIAEIDAALEADVLIIPVLLDSAAIPADVESRLPKQLQGRQLFDRHALTLRSPQYDYDFNRLCKAVVEAGVPTSRSLAKTKASLAAIGLVALATIVGFQIASSAGSKTKTPQGRSGTNDRLPLVANEISPSCQKRLAGATVETVYGIASTCEDESIRDLAKQLKANPALLLSRIREVL